MKKSLLFLILILPIFSLSQTDSIKKKEVDSTIINLKNDKIIWVKIHNLKDRRTLMIEEKRMRPAKYLGFGVNFCGLLDPKTSFDLPDSINFIDLDYTSSIGFQLNIFDKRFRINDHFGIVTGLGFQFNNYNLKNKDYPISTSDNKLLPDTIQRNVSKQVLKNVYVHIPLFIDFAPLRKKYRFSLGVTASYMINQHIKEIVESEEGKNVIKRKENVHFNPFALSPTFEIGYQFITMYFNYGLTPVFGKKKGPELRSFTAGIRLNL